MTQILKTKGWQMGVMFKDCVEGMIWRMCRGCDLKNVEGVI
jgi:hypothetical protein